MVHPKIAEFVSIVAENSYKEASVALLFFLKELGATQTEAIVVLHQGLKMSLDDADKFVLSVNDIFDSETIEDAAYQTFLYLNYDPTDPNFTYDKNLVQFPMKRKKD